MMLVGQSVGRRVTRDVLDGAFGKDKYKPVVVSQEAGDLLVFWVRGTRRKERLSVLDAYKVALRSRIRLESLEKARKKKGLK